MAFICPCYALVELSSFLFVLILLGYILVDVFVPAILARDVAIVLQLFFLLSACLVLPLPFVPAHFPCMVLWSFIFLHVGFLLHQALISHYCTIGQKIFFERSLVPFCGMGFVPSIIFDSWFSYCQYPLALDVFSRPTLQLFFIACLMVRP